jgi:hypothetical protein
MMTSTISGQPTHTPRTSSDLELLRPSEPQTGTWRRNSRLALACFGLFLVFWAAQSLAGWHVYNADQASHQEAEVGYLSYLTTGHFAEATFENWESEFLQMGAFVLLTAFLIQKGSAESKKSDDDDVDEDPRAHRDDPDAPWPVHRGGLWLTLYENSLLLAFCSSSLSRSSAMPSAARRSTAQNSRAMARPRSVCLSS